jgi:hypothetical protein
MNTINTLLSLSRSAAVAGGLALALMESAVARDVDPSTYGYPLTNPFEATVTTTPHELRPKLPKDTHIRQKDFTLQLHPERSAVLTANFWPVKEMKYRIARQKHAAPLVFIIAGTGAHYASSTPEYLKRLLYGAGYHVVQISSPTSWDFIASASQQATPGYSPADAEDLYSVMEAVRAQNPDLPVTDYYLTGYSLGALHAAFVSKLDETRHSFNFKRVLMLNPPVNLFTSVSNLDKLSLTQVEGINDSQTFYQKILKKLSRYFKDKGYIDLDEAFLYDLQQSRERLSNEEIAMLIGAVFRLSSADIAFSSDLINRRGMITPADYKIDSGTSLTPLFKQALLCNFDCYMTNQLVPMWRAEHGGGSVAELVNQVSLYALKDYLHDSPKIAVMHNADDLILGPGDIDFLRETFGDRLTLYPLGGHCGNLNYRVNAQDMLDFFKGKTATQNTSVDLQASLHKDDKL